jgi:conjugal transfer/entry exclusion protein
MVATQINQYVTQVAQLSSMKQNLFMLPLAVVGKALGPYKDQYLPYFNAYKSVTALKDSAFRANTVLSGEISAMSRLNMTPQQYTQAMIQAAKERGGYYKQSLDSTTAALQDVQKRGEALAQLHDQIPQIDGNIKGMQTLATTNMQMIGEMQNMNAAILQQKAASEVEGKLREDEKEAAQARRLEFEKGKAAAEAWEKKIMSGGK